MIFSGAVKAQVPEFTFGFEKEVITDDEFFKQYNQLYKHLYRNEPDEFVKIFAGLTPSLQRRFAEFREAESNASLLAHATEGLSTYYPEEGPKGVSGTPIRLICKYDYSALNEVFFDYNSSLMETPLTRALRKGFIDVVDALLDCDADPSLTSQNSMASMGTAVVYPIHLAAQLGHWETYKRIADSVEPTNETYDWRGKTPLRWAYMGRQYKNSQPSAFPELGADHDKIIEDLRQRGVTRMTRYGCEVMHLRDLVPDLTSEAIVVGNDSYQRDDRQNDPEKVFPLERHKFLTNALIKAQEICRDEGYSGCEPVSAQFLREKGVDLATNPHFKDHLITKNITLNLGEGSQAHRTVKLWSRSVNGTFYALDEGVTVDQCEHLKSENPAVFQP